MGLLSELLRSLSLVATPFVFRLICGGHFRWKMMFRVGLALLEMVQEELCLLELEEIMVFFRKRNPDGSVSAFKFCECRSSTGRHVELCHFSLFFRPFPLTPFALSVSKASPLWFEGLCSSRSHANNLRH